MSWHRYDASVLQNDPETYDQMADALWNLQGITTTDGYHVILPPGYAVLRGAVISWIGDGFESAKILGVILLAVTASLLYKTIHVFVSPIWSGIAVLLWMTNGYIISSTVNGYADLFFMCVFVLFIYLHISLLIKKNPVTYLSVFALGCVWAMLFYIRPEGLLIGGLGLVLLLRNKIPLRNLILYASVFLVLTTPYVFFIKQMTGVWQFSGKSYVNLVLGEIESPYQHPNNIRTDRYDIISHINAEPTLAKSFMDYFEEGNAITWTRMLWNFKAWSNILIGTVGVFGVILAFIGILYGNRIQIIMTFPALLPCFAYMLFFYNGRVVSIYHFVWAFWMMMGIKKTYESIIQRWDSVRLARFVSLGMIAGVTLYQSRLVYLWYLR